jgi:hypothetical protein
MNGLPVKQQHSSSNSVMRAIYVGVAISLFIAGYTIGLLSGGGAPADHGAASNKEFWRHWSHHTAWQANFSGSTSALVRQVIDQENRSSQLIGTPVMVEVDWDNPMFQLIEQQYRPTERVRRK